jgi:hypothetical protein
LAAGDDEQDVARKREHRAAEERAPRADAALEDAPVNQSLGPIAVSVELLVICISARSPG